MNRTTAVLAAATVALVALAWVDALYLPLVALGPLVAGLVAGSLGAGPRLAAVPWVVAGLAVLVIDLAATGEDAAFHLAVTAYSGLLAAGAAALGRMVRARRAVTA